MESIPLQHKQGVVAVAEMQMVDVGLEQPRRWWRVNLDEDASSGSPLPQLMAVISHVYVNRPSGAARATTPVAQHHEHHKDIHGDGDNDKRQLQNRSNIVDDYIEDEDADIDHTHVMFHMKDGTLSSHYHSLTPGPSMPTICQENSRFSLLGKAVPYAVPEVAAAADHIVVLVYEYQSHESHPDPMSSALFANPLSRPRLPPPPSPVTAVNTMRGFDTVGSRYRKIKSH